jgi:hypothetical protein
VRLNPKQKRLGVNSWVQPERFIPHPSDRSLDHASAGTDAWSGELRTASFPRNKNLGNRISSPQIYQPVAIAEENYRSLLFVIPSAAERICSGLNPKQRPYE